MAEDAPKTWILTGSLENFRINVERNFDVIGLKERRIRQAEQFMTDDRVIFYVTGIKAFGGIARVLSPMFEDREPIWPQGKKKVHEDYPWRVQAEPVLVLDEADFVPAESLLGEMEHLSKWPAEHWTLAFQGQLRTISEADSELLESRIRSAKRKASVPALAAVASHEPPMISGRPTSVPRPIDSPRTTTPASSATTGAM